MMLLNDVYELLLYYIYLLRYYKSRESFEYIYLLLLLLIM